MQVDSKVTALVSELSVEKPTDHSAQSLRASSFDITLDVDLAGPQHKYHIAIGNIAANTSVSVLIPLLFSTSDTIYDLSWQALVHFIYTGDIRFAPLRSQGLDIRRAAQVKHEKRHPDLPPLCSPKSVYRLAVIVSAMDKPRGLELMYGWLCIQVDIPVLKELAQQDIKAKITSLSSSRELFSRFSSMYVSLRAIEP